MLFIRLKIGLDILSEIVPLKILKSIFRQKDLVILCQHVLVVKGMYTLSGETTLLNCLGVNSFLLEKITFLRRGLVCKKANQLILYAYHLVFTHLLFISLSVCLSVTHIYGMHVSLCNYTDMGQLSVCFFFIWKANFLFESFIKLQSGVGVMNCQLNIILFYISLNWISWKDF